MEEENIIKKTSYLFAVRIIRLFQYLTTAKKEFILSKQLLRSGTSVEAQVRESEYSESNADFIHKFAFAQKEFDSII
jgi:four helix bundle protein